jgi:hypothetical protein
LEFFGRNEKREALGLVAQHKKNFQKMKEYWQSSFCSCMSTNEKIRIPSNEKILEVVMVFFASSFVVGQFLPGIVKRTIENAIMACAMTAWVANYVDEQAIQCKERIRQLQGVIEWDDRILEVLKKIQ